MSCLKSAGMVLGPMDIEPKKKVQLTIAAARHFEKYINDTIFGEPSGNSKDKGKNYKYQGDDDLGL